MLNSIIKKLNEVDKITYNLIKIGLKLSFNIAIIASILLLLYMTKSYSINTYYAGISILKSSIIFSVAFIICGISMDTIKKQVF